jgi:Xaa-Pro aminopeptidase
VTAAGSSIPADRYRQRLAAAQARVAGAGLEAILVGVGPDLRYLTGYPAMPLERLTMLVIPAQGDLALVVPRLEATPARS